ncbi:enoyl-CoA hydratase/isomerase family protein [Sporosarcina sp. 179-K 3D1 HS]|uniref:enoyl-CoA hydratase/isomerase family protein n=1 Tax=Sporosarcina sp. 179-K 3D1 HS TaxID=3232169 RepID=UPI0039A302EC
MTDAPILVNEEIVNGKTLVTVILNRPQQLNAVDGSLLHKLCEIINGLSRNPNIGALLIKSNNASSFCTGIDVKYVNSLSNEQSARFFEKLSCLLQRIIDFPYPTVASIDGYAFGAGADIALACDIRIGNRDATFRFPGPQFGLLLGTQRLIQEVGPSKARYLTLTNSKLDATQALQYGLLHEVDQNESAFIGAYSYAKMVTGITNYTFSMIDNLCSEDRSGKRCPIALAKQSVEHDDFKMRFLHYLSEVRVMKKGGTSNETPS